MPAGSFVDMENAADIGPEDFFERALYRDTAEVQDGVYPFNQLVNGVFIGKIAQEDFFMAAGSRCHWCDIREPQHLGIGLEAFAQHLPQTASSTGEKKAIEGSLDSVSGCHQRSLSFLLVSSVVV